MVSQAVSVPAAAQRPSFGTRTGSTSDRDPAPRESAPAVTSRRGIREGVRDTGLVLRGGRYYHAFDARVAPYPVSYDREIIDLDTLEHRHVLHTRGNVTCFDFRDTPPARSLDLGCGNGAWVLEAAKTWKNCHFVGYDLVRLQPKTHLLSPDVASRIKWVQGNFLTERLPFEDNDFDHVRIFRIAWGVAEMQWDGIFAEVARVLRPGGALEMVEEDILFPILPRSYTIKAKRPRPSAPYPRPAVTLSPTPSPIDDAPASTIHAHALLESLFLGLFESRLINLHPTAIIPHHLNIHFRNVLSSASLECPFPPPPLARQQLRHAFDTTAQATWNRANESVSSLSTADAFPAGNTQQQQTPPMACTSLSPLPVPSSPPLPAPMLPPFVPVQAYLSSFKVTDPTSVPLLPPVPVDVHDRNFALLLTVVLQRILGCKEAMWEELRHRLMVRRAGGPDLLRDVGWDEADAGGDSSESGQGDWPGQEQGEGAGWGEGLERARGRFEELTARFERDMRYRTALPDALQTTLGWSRPAPSPMTKHERARELEIEQAIADAAREEAEDEAPLYLRRFRGFVGFKEGMR